MNLKRIVGSCLLVVGTVILQAGAPALAHSGGPPKEGGVFCEGKDPGPPYGGLVASCFESHGDDFWVRDEEEDGARVGVYWRTSYGREGFCSNSHGYGRWHECKYDMKENTTVTWWHYYYNRYYGTWMKASGPYESPTTGTFPA